MMDFDVGDKVVHWNYGLGEILMMDVKFIHGREMLCYVVKIQDLTIWVTADDPEKSSLRSPTPEGDFGELFEILQSQGEPLPVDRFDRKAQLTERMKDGKLTSICSVIRDLFFYRREKKLNDYDKNTLNRAQSFLLTEWMFSLAVPQLQAKDELLQLLGAT
jgi:RNA polymerase-interacting CarD/CdnL/TRCF family regulator